MLAGLDAKSSVAGVTTGAIAAMAIIERSASFMGLTRPR